MIVRQNGRVNLIIQIHKGLAVRGIGEPGRRSMGLKAHPDCVAVDRNLFAVQRIRAVPVDYGNDSERLLPDLLVICDLKKEVVLLVLEVKEAGKLLIPVKRQGDACRRFKIKIGLASDKHRLVLVRIRGLAAINPKM